MNGVEALRERLMEALRQASPRDAIMLSLSALIAFIDAEVDTSGNDLSAPISALQIALHDLAVGTVAPFLVPTTFPNAHPEPSSRKFVKAYAIHCIDYLKHKSFGVKKASMIVASALIKSGFAIGGKTGIEPWRTVKTWRDEASRLPSDRDQTAMILRELRGDPAYELPADLTPEKATRHVTQLLSMLVAKTLARE